MLFGSARLQELLLQIARVGKAQVKNASRLSFHRRLVEIGICTSRREPGADVLGLDPRHPAAAEVRAVLEDLAGQPVVEGEADGVGTVHPTTPLGHIGPVPFRLMLVIARAAEPLDEETVRRRIPDIWPSAVREGLERLVADGVLAGGEGRRYSMAVEVPSSFTALVLRLAELIDDPRLAPSQAAGPRAAAFMSAADGAPRLFGTDARLRHLMALAVHGPMLYRDLRRMTGAYHLHEEAPDDAPFGRAGLVRTWKTPDGTALALDEAHPLHPPLIRLLVRLAEVYPMAPHVPAFGRPEPPPPQVWSGDRLALFGSAIPTKILMTLAGRGWTFEALCCGGTDSSGANDNIRIPTKKAIRRLEAEGVLEGSRPRGPGFGPRLLRIAEAFPARDELQALIDAIPAAWPDLGDRVERAFADLPEKTKTYFRRRDLL